MLEETETVERQQVNISPSPETLELLRLAVDKFGSRHRNAKTRNTAAADVLDKFVHVWFALLEKQDEAYRKSADEIMEQAVAGVAKKRR